MNGERILRRAPRSTAVAAVAVCVLAAALALAAALEDVNRFKAPLVWFLSARSGRDIRIAGPLRAHLWSLAPEVVGERITIGNPPWMPPGRTAEIGRLAVTFELLPLLSHEFVVRRLEMDSATLQLARDASGRANWQWTDPVRRPGKGLPLIHSLVMQDAQLALDDARRHLKFDGTVSAQDTPGPRGPPPLRIDGWGRLNGRPVTFAINADPLALVRRGQSYRFAFLERSSGSRLRGRGFFPRPFDFRALETTFDAEGEDLKDLYFLTGVTLLDTGTYRLSGKLGRQGTHFTFSDLSAESGESDLQGALTIEASVGHRSQIDVELGSRRLRLSDVGPRAAGRAPVRPAPASPLPETPLRVAGLRVSEWKIRYRARALEAGSVTLHAVTMRATIDHGVLAVEPFLASLPQGKLTGAVKLDATRDVPAVDVDLKAADLALGQFERKTRAEPVVDGLLQARIELKGRGRSARQLAAAADGAVTAVLPHGEVRASLAELAGLDLAHALGLVLKKDALQTGVRCAIASFVVHEGTATAQSLLIDTDPVLITGQGVVHLDSETLDLALRGRPKHPRVVHVRAPLEIRGPFAHPALSIARRDSLAQAGEALALGVVLTPLAAVLAFVDPGLAKDANCAALLAEAKSQGVPLNSDVPAR